MDSGIDSGTDPDAVVCGRGRDGTSRVNGSFHTAGHGPAGNSGRRPDHPAEYGSAGNARLGSYHPAGNGSARVPDGTAFRFADGRGVSVGKCSPDCLARNADINAGTGDRNG